MIVDSSAILAVLRAEAEGLACAQAINAAETVRVSAATYLEAAIVIDSGRDPRASRDFDEFFRSAGIVIEPVTAEQVQIARQAYRDFGKGSGHPARLNFGDCFTYALASVLGEPLLFKGQDFMHTDVVSALD